MSVATSTAIGIAGAVTAGAGIAGSAIASSKQSSAAKQAAALQQQSAANSLAFQQQIYGDQKAAEAPFVAAGQTAVNRLGADLAPGGSLAQNWNTPFSFTGVSLQNDPAYQFDLQQGQQAIQRSAAAQGGLVSGGALKDLNNYSQGYAANQFQQSYANALGQYQQAYNIFQNNQSNQFNRNAALAGIGQTGTANLSAAGSNAANNYSNTSMAGAAGAGNYLTQAGTANSAGVMGVSNALGSAANSFANYQMLSGSSFGGKGSGGVYDASGNYLGE